MHQIKVNFLKFFTHRLFCVGAYNLYLLEKCHVANTIYPTATIIMHDNMFLLCWKILRIYIHLRPKFFNLFCLAAYTLSFLFWYSQSISAAQIHITSIYPPTTIIMHGKKSLLCWEMLGAYLHLKQHFSTFLPRGAHSVF